MPRGGGGRGAGRGPTRVRAEEKGLAQRTYGSPTACWTRHGGGAAYAFQDTAGRFRVTFYLLCWVRRSDDEQGWGGSVLCTTAAGYMAVRCMPSHRWNVHRAMQMYVMYMCTECSPPCSRNLSTPAHMLQREFPSAVLLLAEIRMYRIKEECMGVTCMDRTHRWPARCSLGRMS